MTRIKFISMISLLVLTAAVYTGCKKETALEIAPEYAHFNGTQSGNYSVTAPGIVYKIPIGTTTVSSFDRTINVSVSSPTGAVQGTHYSLNKTSFVIPAGEAVDTLVVTAVHSQYTAGRKDTLLFEIAGSDKGGLGGLPENSRYTLLVRGPCFEGEIATALQDLLGDYNNTRDTLSGAFTYGPYKTTVKSVTMVTPTSARIVVANIYDEGWNDLTFTLDWSSITDRTLSLETQNAGGNAGSLFGAAFNGMPYGITPVTGLTGTFSYCNQTLTIKAHIGVYGVGYAPNIYTVKMSR